MIYLPTSDVDKILRRIWMKAVRRQDKFTKRGQRIICCLICNYELAAPGSG